MPNYSTKLPVRPHANAGVRLVFVSVSNSVVSHRTLFSHRLTQKALPVAAGLGECACFLCFAKECLHLLPRCDVRSLRRSSHSPTHKEANTFIHTKHRYVSSRPQLAPRMLEFPWFHFVPAIALAAGNFCLNMSSIIYR